MDALCWLNAGLTFLGGLCWGSFLNLFAHRILHSKNIFTMRSYCPHCHHVIAWYDNIPVVSWLFLRAECRQCKQSISVLYPFVELVSGIIITALFYKYCGHILVCEHDVVWWDALEPIKPLSFFATDALSSFFSYLPFVSALIASTRTDLEGMVIPQLFTLWLVPLGLLLAYVGVLEITFIESILGVIAGYGILWAVAWLFKKVTGKDGMGEGDMELLALIGSFLGPLGCWFSLLIGSLVGLVIGSVYVFWWKKDQTARIPFGPFLSLGAIVYLFYAHFLIHLFLF